MSMVMIMGMRSKTDLVGLCACDQKWLLLTSYLKSYLEDASVQSSMDVLPFTALESVTPATQ